MADSKNTVQARVTAYHKWVIEHLAETGGGTFGLNPSSVLAAIIREWILTHEDFLKSRHLDEATFRKPTRVPDLGAKTQKNSHGVRASET